MATHFHMNDRAELDAVVLAAEAVEIDVDAFPNAVEFSFDNLAVCDACRAIASGVPIKATMAHYPWYRRFARVLSNIDRPGFFLFQWVPSHIRDV